VEILFQSLIEDWHSLLRLAPRIVLAVLVIVISFQVGRVLGRIFARVLAHGRLTDTHRNFFRGLFAWTFGIIGIILALNLIGLNGLAAGLLAGGGITAVVIGFAFRQIGENFLAGFFLAFSSPFKIGDLIQSGDLQGVVRGIELRSTHIRTADARDIFIPSSRIFNDPLVNFTRDGLRRPSFTVGIDYADDSQEARRLLLEAARATPNVLPDPEPGANISALAPDYVEIEVFFWINTFGEGISFPRIRTEVMERCRRALVSGGFTVSSNVTTNLEGGRGEPFEIELCGAGECGAP
jgi:small conductance mechanosensitive channel